MHGAQPPSSGPRLFDPAMSGWFRDSKKDFVLTYGLIGGYVGMKAIPIDGSTLLRPIEMPLPMFRALSGRQGKEGEQQHRKERIQGERERVAGPDRGRACKEGNGRGIYQEREKGEKREGRRVPGRTLAHNSLLLKRIVPYRDGQHFGALT
ncbi:hypothetical protein JB92DRAFT_2838325 [Gautieria morchelliformis]|nr:hypothetical protein JB92DRAFT_2838325 [Gautieria morchelliformis]